MDKNFEELCYSCRTGDVENVDKLISTGVNLNTVDRFDNSPLFLASLCGHEGVVKLLLKRGAICDRDRYEGARCIYGALTDSIRDVLLSYDVSKAVDMNQPFATHISSLIKDTSCSSFDISFHFNNESNRLHAHKFMIQARCPQLFKKLGVFSDNKSIFKVHDDIPLYIFDMILKYIYLVPILHIIRHSDYDNLIRLSQILEMQNLTEFLDKARHVSNPSEKSALMLEYQHKFTTNTSRELKAFVNNYIIKNGVDLKDSDCFKEAIISVEKNMDNGTYPDIFVCVGDENGPIKLYPCHLSILLRADYFRYMFSNPYLEDVEYSNCHSIDNISELPVFQISVPNLAVFEMVLKYLYYDESNIPWNYAIEVIYLSDFIMVERLKSMAATTVTQNSNILKLYSIFDILHFAWETRMDRLEQHVAKYAADHLSSLSSSKDFKEAIIRSSKRISNREEKDTIEFIDDIKFYLLEKYDLETDDILYIDNCKTSDNVMDGMLLDDDMLSYDNDIALIEKVLEELGLKV